MGLFDNVRLAGAALMGRVVTAGPWNWRSGTKPGHLFDGSKFRGGLMYPSEITADTDTLRLRSRMAYWESPQARALLSRLKTTVIGTGLALDPRPIWELVGDQGMTEDEMHTWCRDVAVRFDLWASSHEPDAGGRFNLYELQAIEYLNRLRDGETFNILRYSGDTSRMNPVNVQMLLPELVGDPIDAAPAQAAEAAGRRIVCGIEVDKITNQELAIHVEDPDTHRFTRVPVSGASGRRFVVHALVVDVLNSVRGTPVLGPVIHDLQKLVDYGVAELEAAVLNAILAVWVKPSPDANASKALAGIQRRGADARSESTGRKNETRTETFEKPGLIVQSLQAGEEIQSFDTKRPNANFGEFVRQVTKHISASLDIPISVLEMAFNANYSASRAELLLFWKKVEIERGFAISQVWGAVYEAWFTEEVKSGRIKAPGFTDGSPVIRRAWLWSSWNGDRLPSLDPEKEANADDLRLRQGSTTHERVAMEFNGSSFAENAKRLAVENAELAEANAPLAPATPVQPNGDQNNQDNQDGSNAGN